MHDLNVWPESFPFYNKSKRRPVNTYISEIGKSVKIDTNKGTLHRPTSRGNSGKRSSSAS